MTIIISPIQFTRCEIIRDYKTDESLQYAFIEFEEVSHLFYIKSKVVQIFNYYIC